METCKLHPKTPSTKCRTCKKISEGQPKPAAYTPELRPPPSKNGQVEVHGNKFTFNLNEVVIKNVLASAYFRDISHKSVPETVAEIAEKVHSIEPWVPGCFNMPSSLMCCVYRLLQLKVTEKQLRIILEHQSAFVRVAGLLCIRLICNPEELWHRLEQSLVDPLPVVRDLTVGQVAEGLLIEQSYYTLQLPRIPMLLHNLILQKLELVASRRARAKDNSRKQWAKGTSLYAEVSGEWQSCEFKAYDANKAHVQVNGIDMHLPLADLAEQVPRGLSAAPMRAPPLSVPQRQTNYMLAMPLNVRKRSRSRSPEPVAVRAQVRDVAAERRTAELEAVYNPVAVGANLTERLHKTDRNHRGDLLGPECLNLK